MTKPFFYESSESLTAEYPCEHNPKVPLKVAYSKSASVNHYTDEDGNLVMHGKTIGFLEYLHQAYKWTTEHIKSIDGKWGGPNRTHPKASFNGMIGMVQREEVDMAACIMSITHTRFQVVDFSVPYYYDAAKYLSHKPGFAPKWEVLTFPYKLHAWIGIIALFCIFTPLFYCILLLARDKSFTIPHCIMACYKQLFGTGTDLLPAKVIPLYVFGIWCLMVSILNKAYSGNLLAALTKQVTLPKIDTLEDLYESDYHELILIFWTNHKNFFNNTAIAEKKNDELEVKRYTNALTKYKGRDRVRGGHKAFYLANPHAVILMDQEAYELQIEQSWGLPPGKYFTRWSEESAFPAFHGIAVKKGSPLKKCIDEKILRSQEAGLWHKWRADAVNTFRKKHPIDKEERLEMDAYLLTLPGNTAENEPLSLIQMQTAFYIFSGMIFMAIFSFIMEKVAEKICTTFTV